LIDQVPMPDWKLAKPLWCYLSLCAILTVLVGAFIFLFRALAVERGDVPHSEKDKGERKARAFWPAYWESFKGFGNDKAHADFWLNAFIGFAELAAYPFLLKTGYQAYIGGWLLLKAAGNWGGWATSRTSFNRFLLSNIIELAIAKFWLVHYVQ
jgi:hypothetical protein